MTDLFKVMERERLCSEHAAMCFIEAKRRDAKKKKNGNDGVKPGPVKNSKNDFRR